MSNKVSLIAATYDLTFTDTKAEMHLDAAYFGARTYSFSPIFAFLTVSGTTMSL